MMFGKNKQPYKSTNASDGSNSVNSESAKVLGLLAQDYLREKVSRRRWGIFFRIVIVFYVVGTTIAYFKSADSAVRGEHTAVVEINGVIGPDDLSSSIVNRSLKNAFSADDSVGVIIKINSPGGTPVQAAQINEEITRLKAIYSDKPVYAAVVDICASGGYYVAVAADKIFAHPSSIVGSIGVLMNGFGFVGTMEKLGIERRLITAGENKGILDPFSPVDPVQQRHAESILSEVHQQFINAVKTGRGDRISEFTDVFSGLFWSGERAKELGLIDQFGSAELIARDILGAENLVDYTYRPNFIDQFANRIGAAISRTFMTQSRTFF